MTVADLLTGTLTDLGVLIAGEAMQPDDEALAFSRLNDWLDDLKTQNLSVFTVNRTTWTIAANTATYTVGVGATINVARPLRAQDITVKYRDTSATTPVELLLENLTEDAWQAVPSKTLTGVYPIAAYYAPTYTSSGYASLSLWMVPTSATLQGVLYSLAPVDEFTATSQTIALPPGYRRFLRSNLAMELAPAFNVEMTPALVQAATDSKANVKRSNERLTDMRVDAAVLMHRGPLYNIYTD